MKKIEQAKKTSIRPIIFHVIEILFTCLVLCWYVFPFLIEGFITINPHQIPYDLFPAEGGGFIFIILLSIMIYIIPAICVFKIASLFLRKKIPLFCDPEYAFPLLFNIISSFCILFLLGLYLIQFASSPAFFTTISIYTYILCGITVIYNITFIVFLIRRLNEKNANYREYLEFKKKVKGVDKSSLKVVMKVGIQKKLVITFIGLIFVLLIALTVILMTEFSNAILKNAFYNGETLTERTADMIKNSFDDPIAISEYFYILNTKNEESEFPFISVSYYAPDKGNKDKFLIAASSNEELVGTGLEEEYIGIEEPQFGYIRARRTYEFISAPILIGKAATHLGFAKVVYDRDVIYEAYFRTQVKVITFSALFIYLAVILVYIFGSKIVFPILFLRMNVNRISNTLANMMRGKLKISAKLLEFKDVVKTKDEIKTLSSEIGNMTDVIRGVIPYISASTFKHAEKQKPTSTKREMAFLFTDIRGFTTLCEGLSPANVVQILNRYLDLQSSIILQHSGDIDKFVGDEIMASFEGSNKEKNACLAAMEIRKAMAQEQEARRAKKQKTIAIGIGINSGPVVFGSVGARERMDFTSIGDTVNLAARLEGINKQYGTKTLVTDTVFNKVKDIFICRQIDLITVKGKTKPVKIYEILQAKRKAAKKILEIKKYFEAGLGSYRQRKWQEAKKYFKECNTKFQDTASQVFINRIDLFRQKPPPRNWDGVFRFTVK